VIIKMPKTSYGAIAAGGFLYDERLPDRYFC